MRIRQSFQNVCWDYAACSKTAQLTVCLGHTVYAGTGAFQVCQQPPSTCALETNGFSVRARQQLCPLDSAPKNCHVQTAVAQRSPHIATFPYIATPNSVPRWGWLRSSDVLSRGMPEDV